MKRSEINEIIKDAADFIRKQGFYLPPFAYWTPSTWQLLDEEAKEIVEAHLGWDLTDFGSGKFSECGLILFTIRNGLPENLITQTGKLYAEKILIVDVDQITPMHYHWNKTEDIINRGGGKLVLQLYNSDDNNGLDDTEVTISIDGIRRRVQAGGTVELNPGESITLPTRLYHKFWGKAGRVLVGEVSLVNDDHKDNCFLEAVGRFPSIEEDVEPMYLLCNDYSRYYKYG
jgi:D-lyxose ketol-isomerase